ncbi:MULTISPECIES: M1 family metallopeptidase [Pseudoxanthomonas]|uniref:Aminopeptidase N n=1 Tax=Pseudoxanthomonas winnipegensis TaxID=2480810 RepID=A0AAW8GB73_9GAMM|nr:MULTISPECIES: M1 family metallopeptidase [Pseudoxanthomonas]MDQ1118853.1 aminopeptidase N [Pseudoxanthomonas winnipegensis]MDQ1132041.1 aminopeptidase N [Pseudoxanthomonas winnipegensis]MDR6137945.1 aminopeptidase N [Pseudoxanthomonas sp. SORGH_AS_0997]
MSRSRLLVSTLALALACVSQAHGAELSPVTKQTGLPRTPEQLAVSFEHADLGFKVIPDQRRIEGDATLTFKAISPLQALVVDLDPEYAVSRVEVDGKPVAREAWQNPEGRMRVTLPRQVPAGGSVKLRVVYAGQPHVAKRAPWDGGFVWATAPTGEPWVASAIQGEGCDLLWPCIDHPQGEPALVDEHITVPAPLVAPGNGVFVGMQERKGWRTYHWRAKNPDTYAIALDVGPYEQLSGSYKSRYGNTIPLAYWYLKGDKDAQAKALFDELPKMLDFFESQIGPYPFGDEKVGVVQTPHLGMEHQTINAYGNDYKKDKYGYDWLMQHEFSHEWFGNQLTNADWDDMWLHEGFGSYMQPLYLQYLRGEMDYHAALLDQRAAVTNRVPIVSGKSQTEEAVYNREHGAGLDIYYKGSLMLHTLRSLIGDEAFFTSIRLAVYGSAHPRPGHFKPRYVSTRDYIDIVNKVTGKDYGWFFDVYLYRAALPELIAERDAGGLSLRWKTPGDLPFPMPVDVRIGPNSGRTVTVPMTDGRGHVALQDNDLYTLDPQSKLLREEPRFAAAVKDAAERKAAADKAAADKKADKPKP